MGTHLVEKHLRVTAKQYDEAIRTFIPYYDEMLKIGIDLVKALAKKSPHVLDLGGGTGALTQAILRGIPKAKVNLIDIDPYMLSEAKRRLGSEKERVTFLECSFFDSLPKSDAIVASLSLHHIQNIEQKTKVYAAIAESLKPGGLFLNLDATLSFDDKVRKITFDNWAAFMGEHGISLQNANKYFTEWATEDYYLPLITELKCLSQAGFPHPECFWRRGPITVFGGLAPS
jgi:tRNA (cmo5U34)-methyltransferase